ncbi:MAG TPA: cation diffusion facilitator family transporter [Gaiellales bacterium]|nr:cation diffusion facilitator family transporter [Gaiellales bacterium]
MSNARAHATPDGHAGHSHAIDPDADRRRLSAALLLILALMAVEVVVGIVGNSLALLADAAHMLTDAGALGLSLWVIRLIARPPVGGFTFGLRRSEVLSAQANGFTLLVLSGLVVYEGVSRLLHPPRPAGAAMLAVALLGVAVNLAATRQLALANRRSMNVEGSYQHVLTDLIAFVATAVAGVVILTTGWARADGVAALLVSAIMLRAAYGLLKASGRVLLEAAPEGIDPAVVGQAMADHAGVSEVHDLHVWEVGSGFPSLSAHVLVAPGDDCHGIRRSLEALLHERFGIDHTTLQVDHRQPELVPIRPRLRP